MVNPELAVGLPAIDVRLGLDGGEAAMVVLGSDKTKRHADLIGDVVSLACKIEARADSGEIFLGETVHRNLHFSWRELCAPVELGPDWTYSVSGGEPYPLFRLDPTGTRPVERAFRRPRDARVLARAAPRPPRARTRRSANAPSPGAPRQTASAPVSASRPVWCGRPFPRSCAATDGK